MRKRKLGNGRNIRGVYKEKDKKGITTRTGGKLSKKKEKDETRKGKVEEIKWKRGKCEHKKTAMKEE